MNPNRGARGATHAADLAFVLLIVLWIVVLGLNLFFGRWTVVNSVTALAETGADAFLNQIVIARRWNASQGTVYVPISNTTPENPYLDPVTRTVRLSDGRTLTQVNPAYMTRQFFEIAALTTNIRGKITSSRVVNPLNEPDAWERSALTALEGGASSVAALAVITDELGSPREVFRYMLPLITESSCLSCHATHGFEMGSLRGALSVQMPFASYRREADKTFRDYALGTVLLALLGFLGIVIGWRAMRRLLAHNLLLRREASHRIANNLALIDGVLALEQVEANAGRRPFDLATFRRRVAGVRTVHQLLHNTTAREERVELSAFFRSIFEETVRQSALSGLQTTFDVDPLEVDPSQAVNLGLLVTELILNALKHGATHPGHAPSVGLRLHPTGGSFVLSVWNAAPANATERMDGERRFGSALVDEMIVALNGRIERSVEDGVHFVRCILPSTLAAR